jgi:hypothetical protein
LWLRDQRRQARAAPAEENAKSSLVFHREIEGDCCAGTV